MPLHKTTRHDPPSSSDLISVLASHVVESLRVRAASRMRFSGGRACPRILADLFDKVNDPRFDSRTATAELMERGLAQDAVSDVYIPAAARQLGADWTEDRISFAQATVVAGRLQEMLGWLVQSNDFMAESHRATPNVLFMAESHRATPNVLVLSFAGDEHTLGWKLITLQLRRLGVAVHAVLDATPAAASEIMDQNAYDLVLISSSRIGVLGQIDAMVDFLHAKMAQVPPLVLGGSVIDLIDDTPLSTNIKAVTNSLDRALSCKKINTSLRSN